MSVGFEARLNPAVERNFPGARIVRAHASASGNVALVASQRAGGRDITVTRLTRDGLDVNARVLAEGGRTVGAAAVSPDGRHAAYDLDGDLHILEEDLDRAAGGPGDRLVAAAWIGDDQLAIAVAPAWPPIHIRHADGRERSLVEPRLPDADRHRPCLAASGETGALAFCWIWSEIVVVPDPDRPASQHLLRADRPETSLALGVWFVDRGRALVVSPWPDIRAGAPIELHAGPADGSNHLEPALRIPCAAAIAPLSATRAIAAPIARPGAIVSFGQGEHTLAELPGRVWGIHPRSDGGLLAWTAETVYWLDPDSH